MCYSLYSYCNCPTFTCLCICTCTSEPQQKADLFCLFGIDFNFLRHIFGCSLFYQDLTLVSEQVGWENLLYSIFTHGIGMKDVLENKKFRLQTSMTKPCPKCSHPIEKNGGCNSMTCRWCLVNFCWKCGQEFGEGHWNHFLCVELRPIVSDKW